MNSGFFFLYLYSLIGRIDEWYHIPARVGLTCYGEVHLILEYRRVEG